MLSHDALLKRIAGPGLCGRAIGNAAARLQRKIDHAPTRPLVTEWRGGCTRAADVEDIATRRISPDDLTGGFTLPPTAAAIVAPLVPTAGHGHLDRVARLHEHGAGEPQELAAVFNDMQARISYFDAEGIRTLGALRQDRRTPITSLRIGAEMLMEATPEPMIRTLDDTTVMADGLLTLARAIGNPIENALRSDSSERTRLSARAGEAVVAVGTDDPRGAAFADGRKPLRRRNGFRIDRFDGPHSQVGRFFSIGWL